MLDHCYATAVECYLAMQGLTTFISLKRVLGWALQNTGAVCQWLSGPKTIDNRPIV